MSRPETDLGDGVEKVLFEADPADIDHYVEALSGEQWLCDDLSAEEILRRAASDETEAKPWQLMDPEESQSDGFGAESWHEGRIAYLINNPPDDPLVLDFVDFPEGAEPIMLDGFHRLAAAVLSGAGTIRFVTAAANTSLAMECLPDCREVEMDQGDGIEPAL